jgi:hypothetical protein
MRLDTVLKIISLQRYSTKPIIERVPTNRRHDENSVTEIVERNENYVTIIAGIHSDIAKTFFGPTFITLVNQLTEQ